MKPLLPILLVLPLLGCGPAEQSITKAPKDCPSLVSQGTQAYRNKTADAETILKTLDEFCGESGSLVGKPGAVPVVRAK